jgi:hypothetical protein
VRQPCVKQLEKRTNYAQKTVASPGDNRLYHIKLKQLKLAVLSEAQPEAQLVLQLQTAVLLELLQTAEPQVPGIRPAARQVSVLQAEPVLQPAPLLQAAEELPEPDKQA